MVPEENRQRPLDILIQACEKPPSSRRFGSSPRETHDALTAGELLAWNNPVQVGSVFVVLCGAPVRLLSWFSSLMFHENVWMCVWDIYIYIYILQGPMFVKPVSCKQNGLFLNCLIVLLLRLAAQQCTQPQSSTYGGHECEEDVRCHGGVPESTNVWVCLLL